jgi:hypothetical protein
MYDMFVATNKMNKGFAKMSKIKTHMNKVWIIAAGAAIITVSSAAMAFALNNNIPENVTANAASITSGAGSGIQNQAGGSVSTAGYTVIDLSKQPINIEQVKAKLSHKAA